MSGPVPPRWLKCPRKSDELIAGKFLAFKTPLDEKFDSQIEPAFRFYPSMVFNSMKAHKVKVGLWIDLCNTSRFYDPSAVREHECTYIKLKCRGHGETPSPEQVDEFILHCRRFVRQHPLEVIGVHCTHGFNRTGFLIASFLIQTEDWSPEAALGAFAKARQPGIYKNDYIQELFRRYGDVHDAPVAPELPDWCFEEETDLGVDDDGNPIAEGNSLQSSSKGSKSHRRERHKKNPKFMEGVPGVTSVTEQPTLSNIQKRIQTLCDWKKNGFPGSQPVSMDRENINNLEKMPYKVSWKADGTRYMMLIDGPDAIYFADRDNCIFHVKNLTFLHRKKPNTHIASTLVDGEMVIDKAHGQEFPRYLIYDIIRFEDEKVGGTNFSTRCLCIDKELIKTREMYIKEGKINKQNEPFSVRQKQFWPLNETVSLLGEKFTSSLGHEPDGLIFQPSDLPYHPGRDDKVLKWKPSSHNSVDFKLQIVRENKMGMLPQTIGYLYVGGYDQPFSQLRLTKETRQLNNKIVECTWDATKNQWIFMRERTDKSYPNAYSTAQGVIKSIVEPVTKEYLLDFIDRRQFRRPPPPICPPSRYYENGSEEPPHKMRRT